ncbi:hypothetical protein A2Y85_02985, partial [candidate division WOR-3 bacterium RBG_13_43_14]
TTKTKHPYIERKKAIGRGRPVIKNTRTSVKNLITYYKMGYTPEEIQYELPHLSLAQVHDAISFYYDNKLEIDKEIAQDTEEIVKKKH